MILLIAQIEKYGVYGELNDKWALLTGILQMMDFDLNVKQISNDEILKEFDNLKGKTYN